MKHKLFTFGLVSILLASGIGTLSGCSDEDSSSESSHTVTKVNHKKSSSTNSESNEESSSGSKSKVPSEYENALATAKDYDEDQPMSKAGLLDQLTSKDGEGFTQDAGQYAVDHLNADWNENALKCARNYLKEEHLSRSDVQEQLSSSIDDRGEGFTSDQVQYAMSHLND